ncbi:electron transport protein [Geobacillus subterraneus]|uniref:electron transport protein n=1 Tax=Geobacillus subterraneus TaxID=129338 RepID=UPI001442D7A7|nr:electron transport protein [Geobacillus subterraneus]QIZ67600.1 electron transport protein [Geobacillus subterraneus]WPZ19791.1 electron transport protein [Geobacillus subterraneus]
MKKAAIALGIAVLLLLAAGAALLLRRGEYAAVPDNEAVKPYKASERTGIDWWGRWIGADDGRVKTLSTANGRLREEDGAVLVDDRLLRLGKEVFYKETFGNEVFLTDIMGIVDGPLTLANIAKAIAALRGEGTTNLRVPLAEDVTIGDRTYKKGELIDTGIDVPKGSYLPLGMPIVTDGGRVRVGISCAACHATVDPQTKKVVEGAPNNDLNAGLLMALATNSAAYFTHANIRSLRDYIDSLDRTIVDSRGRKAALPDPERLEREVDRIFASWPRGNFDSTIDMKANPAQIPDSFTRGDHPYGWSGFAAVGPFRGLSAFSNNVHAQNADSLAQAEISEALFGIDKEVYLGTILQNAANPRYRYRPTTKEKPSVFFAKVDPTPDTVGVNQLVAPPQFPKVSLVAPDGLIVSEPGYRFNEQNNAVAAWQNTLNPPPPNERISPEKAAQGRKVFVRAGCIRCHAGAYLTNNRVIAADVVGTEPSRAKALKKTEKVFGEPVLYAPNTPVPIPKGAKVLKVPTHQLDREQIRLSFAHGDSPGGYKVPSLIGLAWSAPYLHDGGVAVGPNGELGLAGTVGKGIVPDARNSLRALIDRTWRQRVIAANTTDPALPTVHVTGEGHRYWIDRQAGFTKEEQEAVLDYLLSLTSR